MGLKDILHFYKKVDIAIYDGGEPVQAFVEGFDWVMDLEVIAERVNWDYSKIKPILRPLSDMTDYEKSDITKSIGQEISISVPNMQVNINPSLFLYLLKQEFDLFGLIESGQALDKTKLPLTK